MQTRFSQRLSQLMKERKISGQRIGDAIGKSQKTISRYANGEVDPDIETKNLIYKVISDISGVMEDGMTEQELDIHDLLMNETMYFMEHPESGECELGRIYQDELNECRLNQHAIFHTLSSGAKKYYLDNIRCFLMVEEWECRVLEYFHSFKGKKKQEFVKYLENFNVDFDNLNSSYKTVKIAAYMDMINNSHNRPVLLIEKNRAAEEYTSDELSMEEEFMNILDNFEGKIIYYPEYLSFTPYDWYVLMRINIYELYDTDEILWTQEESEVCIGRGLDSLITSMRE